MIDYPKGEPTEVNQEPKRALDLSEIHFINILFFFKTYFKLLIAGTVGTAIVGILYSFTLTKLYKANITLLPEYGMGRRGSFALLEAGANGNGAEKLQPDLYPTILQSTPFGAFLLAQPVTDSKNKDYKRLEDFLKVQAKPGWLSGIVPSFNKMPKKEVRLRNDRILSYSSAEQSSITTVVAMVSSEVDPKSGVIEIGAETIDPFVSAIMVNAAKNYLINYVEAYRSSKVRQRAEVLADRVREAKARLRQSEYTLQRYRDQNRNLFSNTAKIEEQRLQSEYLLAESLYTDLVSRYEQEKIKVKEERPVFKILEPVKVPLIKSSPKRVRIGLIAGFLGFCFTLCYIIIIKERVFQQRRSDA